MSHCVAGVPPVVACGVVPLGVVNSTTGFPRLLPLFAKGAAGVNSPVESGDFVLRPAHR